MDIMTKKERSQRMSLIRGKWTKQEKMLHNYLKSYKVRHKMHPSIPGSPDILILKKRLGIYLHGCFWHGCKKCYREPKSNKSFWVDKLKKNIKRDKKRIKELRNAGYKCLVIWEHQVKKHGMKRILEDIIAIDS